METVPPIDRDELISSIRNSFPAATVQADDSENLNSGCQPWRIEVRHNHHPIELSWGPLWGFGATDIGNPREKKDPFAAYNWPLESIEDAIAFIQWHCLPKE